MAKDAIGQELNVGDIVVHSSGGRSGSTNALCVVTKLSAKKASTWYVGSFTWERMTNPKYSHLCSASQKNLVVITKQFMYSVQTNAEFAQKYQKFLSEYNF